MPSVKQIFYDGRAMSQDGYISCASCHLGGDHDGRTWDFSDRGEGLRNTVDLRGRAGTAHGPVHWSGNFDEIQAVVFGNRTGFVGAHDAKLIALWADHSNRRDANLMVHAV